MANSGSADSNGSQFFLVFKQTTLPAGLHAVRDDYLGAGYPPECGQSRHFVHLLGAGGGVPKEKVIIDNVSIKKT